MTAEDALARLEAMRDDIERAEQRLPDRYWTRDELAFDLAFETPEVIATWVRDNVQYEAYAGVLRGADGVLSSQAGNAWDQSVLLVGLLLDAGYEARIARAVLSDDAASELVATVGPVRGVETAELDEAVGFEAPTLTATLADVEAQIEERRTAVIEASVASARWLRERLDAEGIAFGASRMDQLIADASDYAWVQVRADDTEAWTSFHPAAPAEASWSEDLDPEETFDQSVPEQHQHRFRFQAFVEQRRGGELVVTPVTGPWERPVANLGARAFTYTAMPDGFVGDAIGVSLEAAAEATDFIVPVFDGALAPGGQYFDLMGNVVPPDAASSAAGGLFQSVGGAVGDAVSGVSGQEDAVALTAHWVEYTLIAPGGEETSYRRMLVDRLGPERRSAGTGAGDLLEMTDAAIYDALREQHTFMLAPGRFDAAYVQRKSIEGARLTLDYMELLWRSASEDPGALPDPPDGLGSAWTEGPLLRLFGGFDDERAPLPEAAHTYRASPTLVVSSVHPSGSSANLDVVHNEERAVTVAAGRVVPSAEAAMMRGVWQSHLERYAHPEARITEDAPAFFAAVREQGIAVVTLPDASTDRLDELDIPAESRAAIRSDLERGFAVVAPVAMPEGVALAHWWRIDVADGETLGRGGDGRGNIFAEYSELQIGIAFSVVTGLIGGGACMASGGSVGCCALDAGLYFAAGFAFSSLAGWLMADALLGLGLGMSFDLHSLFFGAAGALPSTCSSGDASLDQHDGLVAISGPNVCIVPGVAGAMASTGMRGIVDEILLG